MFTGLVECVGTVEAVAAVGERLAAGTPSAARLTVAVPDDAFLADAQVGDSIAVSGVCLTAVEVGNRHFVVEAVEETLRRSSLGLKQPGVRVNLERALQASARLGGHIMQGHVDGVGVVSRVRPEGEGLWVTLEPPYDLLRYIVEKGSIAIDGVSLTVANVAYQRFSVAIIPHTRAVTTAGEWEPGVTVNLEVDIISKYVERLMQWRQAEAAGAAPGVQPGVQSV